MGGDSDKFEWQLLVPSFDETFKAFSDFSAADVGLVIGAVLWVLILRVPLTGIDRRDMAARATYVLFMAAAAVTLVIALPGRLAGKSDFNARQMAIFIASAVIASTRWALSRSPGPQVANPQVAASLAPSIEVKK